MTAPRSCDMRYQPICSASSRRRSARSDRMSHCSYCSAVQPHSTVRMRWTSGDRATYVMSAATENSSSGSRASRADRAATIRDWPVRRCRPDLLHELSRVGVDLGGGCQDVHDRRGPRHEGAADARERPDQRHRVRFVPRCPDLGPLAEGDGLVVTAEGDVKDGLEQRPLGGEQAVQGPPPRRPGPRGRRPARPPRCGPGWSSG